MKKILQKILAWAAGLILWRYRPKIVAITGSVGKTSTKEAIACVLMTKYRVRQSLENYNNEIGLPLSIIGSESPGKNLFGWVAALLKSAAVFLYADFPQILVLEIGTDRPGDIPYLVSVLGDIEVAVITDIGISHLEFFSSPQELVREKISLIKKLKSNSLAVLNFDSPKVFENRNQTKAEVFGYGFAKDAILQASDFHLTFSEGVWGANFKMHYKGTVVPFFLPQALGKPAIYTALASAAVGLHYGIDLATASEALKSYQSPAGRLKLLKGIKRTFIIDDTYNAAPSSTIAALEVLKEIAPVRKVAVIGGMAELGDKTDAGHREVAAKIVEAMIDLVFLVGEKAKIIEDELKKRKFTGRILWYPNADAARLPVQNMILEKDTVLVKGSQAARMEKVVKEIMAEPLKASELLVRQSQKWLNKP